MYENYDVNKDLELKGIWYQPADSFRVLLARAGGNNQKYNALAERLIKPHRRALRNDKADPKVINDLLKEAFSKTVILGWQVKGEGDAFIDGIGNPDDPSDIMDVTPDNILSVLRKYNELYSDIKEMAESSAAYLKEEMEEDSKN